MIYERKSYLNFKRIDMNSIRIRFHEMQEERKSAELIDKYSNVHSNGYTYLQLYQY